MRRLRSLALLLLSLLLSGCVEDAVPVAAPIVVGDAVDTIVDGGTTAPDGITEVMTDISPSLTFRNRGGSDGSGLCVFASITMAGLYQNERGAFHLFEKMLHEPGGGWPEKVDKMMKKYCPGVQYIQYEGRDLAIPELALKTGRMVATTYSGRDPFYKNQTIAHMVDLVFLDAKQACILDNNDCKRRRWMTREEFQSRWTGGGNGWAVILLASRPPPPPKNLAEKK